MSKSPHYLITGAGGGVAGISPQVIDRLLGRGETVRAMVHRDDARADALRARGAEVVVGDLTNPADVNAAMSGIDRMFFSMSVSPDYLQASATVCLAATEVHPLTVLVNMSQMTVSQMTATSTDESHQQQQHFLAEHVINWSGVPAVHIRPTVLLDNPLFGALAANSIRQSGQLVLPFGTGRTSPVASRDVADVVTAVITAPTEHLGRIYELTGPQTLDIGGLADQYAQALGRPVTAVSPSAAEWEAALDKIGLDPHTRQHIATMAKLHHQDRYNRATHDVQTVTGHPAQTVREYVEEHRDLFG
jgi:uncharacterized protein YbjT (DUF2867 family)